MRLQARPKDAKLPRVLQRFVPLLLAAGCAAPVPAVPPEPAESVRTSPPRPSARGAAPEATREPTPVPVGPAPPDLEAVVRPVAPAGARLEFRSPRDGQALDSAQADAVPIRLRDAGFLGAKPGRRIGVVLDDFRVRYLARLPGGLTLGDLVPADRELEEGSHEVVAVLVSESGELLGGQVGAEPVATVQFWVGARPDTAPAPARPRLVYVEPQGTYNGEAAARSARLDYLVLGAEPDLEVSVVRASTQAGAPTALTVVRSPQRIRGLASGDYRFELSLVGHPGTPTGPTASAIGRVVTVNLDAPVE